jgi:hypothetical protein
VPGESCETGCGDSAWGDPVPVSCCGAEDTGDVESCDGDDAYTKEATTGDPAGATTDPDRDAVPADGLTLDTGLATAEGEMTNVTGELVSTWRLGPDPVVVWTT